MSAYGYYHRDAPLVTDAVYDDMCRRAYQQWPVLVHHHKHLLSKDMLTTGSVTANFKAWPQRIACAYTQLIQMQPSLCIQDNT